MPLAYTTGLKTLASVRGEASFTTDSPFRNPFDDFMARVADNLNQTPMVKEIGKVDYGTISIDAIPANFMQSITADLKVDLKPRYDTFIEKHPNLGLWPKLKLWVNDEALKIDFKGDESLKEAFRLRHALDTLKSLSPSATGTGTGTGTDGDASAVIQEAIRDLERSPMPVMAKHFGRFKQLAASAYRNNVTDGRITSPTGSGGIVVKALQLRTNTKHGNMTQCILWCSDVAPADFTASIEAAWRMVHTEDRSVALEQHVIGRVCQFLAETWDYDAENHRFYSTLEDAANDAKKRQFESLTGAQSYQVFEDLLGDRSTSNLKYPTKCFQLTAQKIQLAASKGGHKFKVKIQHNRSVTAEVTREASKSLSAAEYAAISFGVDARKRLRRYERGCCDGGGGTVGLIGGSRVGGGGAEQNPQATALTLDFRRYNPVYCNVVMMVFLMYVTGISDLHAFPRKNKELAKIPVISQAMLDAMLRGFLRRSTWDEGYEGLVRDNRAGHLNWL